MGKWRPLDGWLAAACDPARLVAHGADGDCAEPEFRLRIGAWQRALRQRHGQRIALHLDDSCEFAAALLAGWDAGCVMVLPADLHADTVTVLRDEVDAWICADRSLQPVVVAGNPEPAVPSGGRIGSLQLFTSGSSGQPQAVAKQVAQLQAELDALQQALGAGLEHCRVQATVSHQHIYGLLFRVLWPLCAGRAFARERLQFPEQIAAALAQAPALLVATPAHLGRLPDLPQWPAAAAKLRVVFSSGGALDAASAQRVRAFLGHAPLEIYGSTETGGIAWRRHQGNDSPWQPLPGVAWQIDGERLQLRSAFLADVDTWLQTEDRAEAVGDSFRLLGRADRIVKIEQRRVSLAALERALADDPRVAAARVLSLPGKRDTLGAVIVVAEGISVPADAAGRREWTAALRQRLVACVDAVCWPRQWRFVTALPVDSRGKTSESALRRLFEAELPEAIWELRESDEARLACVLSPDLGAFRGHFDEAAVLPGVALLDWVARWAQQAFTTAGAFAGMEQLKFQRIARPGMRLSFALQRRADGSRIDFSVHSPAGQHASGRLLFGSPR